MKKWESALSRRNADSEGEQEEGLSDCPIFLGVLFFAFIWVALFQINSWLFPLVKQSSFASWIFLPQIIRLIAILLCGGRGALGLFLGALLTGDYSTQALTYNSVILAVFSSLGAFTAVYFFRWYARIPESLEGMTGWHLWQLAIVGALFNSMPTNFYLYMEGLTPSWIAGFSPMFVGDAVGSVLMLYVFRLTQRLWASYSLSRYD